MIKKEYLKKGVFTVEAAVVVPMIVIIAALLIGYCFFVHQTNWYRGAAYEAVVAGLKDRNNQEEAARARISFRTDERPISSGEEDTEVSSGLKLAVSYKGKVLGDVFGSLFSYSGEAALTKFDPVKIKMLEFFLERIKE